MSGFVSRMALFFVAFALYCNAYSQSSSVLGPDLSARIARGEQGPFDVFLLFQQQVDVIALGASYEAERLPVALRSAQLIPLLQQMAASTQGPVLAALAASPEVEQASVQPLWITNAIRCKAGAGILQALGEHSALAMIEMVPRYELADASPMPGPFPVIHGAGGHEASLSVIKADQLWAMGYTGNRRKALIIDTGTDPAHPALRRSWVGVYESEQTGWFGLEDSLYDCNNHGTHVAGTIVGLDRDTRDTIGVAPNGRWMASPAIECQAGPDPTSALQWALDPDGNPATSADIPDAINNSWRFLPNSWGCSSPIQLAINALEAAGVAVICAAGNDFPDYSVGGPAFANYSLVNAFAVGAIDARNASLPIAGFSSHGPTECGGLGALAIKPEVSAPGVGIRSAVRNGGYDAYQGTSMASPHVAGAVLLLKEAFPAASGTAIKLALYYTAIDLGDPGEDNVYGRGMIDVKAAFDYLVAEGYVPAPVSRDTDASVRFVAAPPCGLTHEPEIRLKNLGTDTLFSVSLLRTYSDGVQDTVVWTGSLVTGAEQLFSLPARELPFSARYQVRMEVLLANGGIDDYELDNWDEYSFSALSPISVGMKQLNVCIGGEGLVEADLSANDPGATVVWYNLAVGGIELGEGSTLPTGKISSSRIYYGAAARKAVLGPSPQLNAGGYVDSGTDGGISFDVYAPVTIEAVTVHCATAGKRIIQVRTSRGALVHSLQVELAPGTHRVPLGFEMGIGNGYQLGLGFAEGNLWVQTITPQPLGEPAVLRLITPETGLMPYFFSWEIRYELPCPRVPAFVTVSAGGFDPVVDLQPSGPNQVTLIARPTGGKAYRWWWEDGSTATGQQVQRTYPGPGSYPVQLQVTGPANCSEWIQTSIEVGSTSLDQANFLPGFSFFPNPAEDRLTLQWSGDSRATCWLIDPWGRVCSPKVILEANANSRDFDISNLPMGIFWLNIEVDGRVWVEKVVKTK